MLPARRLNPMQALFDVLTVKAMLGLIGAIPGGARAYVLARVQHGRARALSDIGIGLIFAVSVAEMLTPYAYPASALLVGLLAGLVGGKSLDVLFELVPEVARTLALGWARRLVGERGERSLRGASGWGDLEYPPRRKHHSDNPDAQRVDSPD